MIRLLRIVAVMAMLAGGVPRSSAQSPSTTSSSQAALDEATQLGKLAVKLYGEGKYREAVALAVRALALLEKALGPNHPDVATNLNNLALLYRDQGAYAKAEPLYARALDIREKALGAQPSRCRGELDNLAGPARAPRPARWRRDRPRGGLDREAGHSSRAVRMSWMLKADSWRDWRVCVRI